MAAEDDPALGGADAADDPDLCITGSAFARLGSVRTRRRRSASTPERGHGHATCSSGRVSADLLPEVVPPATRLLRWGRIADDGARCGHGRGRRDPRQPRQSPRSALRGAGSAFISAGTWSLVGLELSQPVIDDRSYAANLTNEGGVGGTVRLLRNVTGLSGCSTSAAGPGRWRATIARSSSSFASQSPPRRSARSSIPTTRSSRRRTTCRGRSGSTARPPASPSRRITGRLFAACSRALR